MISIACSADDYYIPHCGTMLVSLFENNPGESFRIHFLIKQVDDRNLRYLEQLISEYGADCQVHRIEESAVRDFPTEKFHASCWYRILLPELLPDTYRVLYLDADMLVLDSIRPLWEIELGEMLFAATVNPLYPFMPNRVRDQLGLSNDNYLNSGVLLMELDNMRRAHVVDRLRAYAKMHPENPWPEQDALSVVCKGAWESLEPRWNAQSTVFEVPVNKLPFSVQSIREARSNPAIVHFIGPNKPWHYLCRHPCRSEYHKFRRLTPWGECKLEGKTLGNTLIKPFPLGTQLQLKKLARRVRSAANDI